MNEKTTETPTQTPRRSAAAQAASRARRIGGVVRSEAGSTRADTAPTRADTASKTAEAEGAQKSAEAEPASAQKVGRRPSPVPRSRADARADEEHEHAVRRARSRRWIPAIVVAVLVVALAVTDAALFQQWRNRPGVPEQRERLVASVNQAVAKVLSYDYRHLDADESAAASHLSGTFKNQYVTSMNTTIKKNAPPAKAVVVGEVGTSAITSVSGDGKQAVLLVLGQQTVTNAAQKTPRYDMVNLRVTAQLVHGTWLVANLATL